MKIPVVFLCGDKSPYGMAHLESIAEKFDLRAIIIADESRWGIFRKALTGGETFEPEFYNPLLRSYKRISRPTAHKLREIKKTRVLKSFSVPLHVVHDVNNKETHEIIIRYQPEVLLSAAYPQIFKGPLLELAPRGAINFHPSALPRCRGAHPHYWCLASGDSQGGVTAHYMTERLDEGAIITQRTFDIENLYYPEAYKKIICDTPLLVSSVAEFLCDPDAHATPQDESKATYFRNDRMIHHRLDWQVMAAKPLRDRIRAGGAFALFRGVRTVIERARVMEGNRHMTNDVVVPPGVIVDVDHFGVWVATCDGKFLVLENFSERGRLRSGLGWLKKMRAHIGERFE